MACLVHVDSGGALRWWYCLPGHDRSTSLEFLSRLFHVDNGGALRWRYCFPELAQARPVALDTRLLSRTVLESNPPTTPSALP